MNLPITHHTPLIGSATRTGKRHSLNDDHYASFVVLRENTTRRLARRQSASDEETVSFGTMERAVGSAGENTGGVGTATKRMDNVTATRSPTPDPWTDELTQKIQIAVVADGVTTTNGGGQASQIAVESIRANLQDPPSRQETISEWLEFAIQRANEEILFEAKRNPDWKGMSSTIALAAVAGEKLYILHLGDSRAYLIRNNRIHQLTSDHTWAQESRNSGLAAPGEGSAQPGSNHLLRYLGAQKLPAVDRGILSPVSDQREEYLLVEPGDVVLLCTDGFYRRLAADEITQTVWAHHGYPQDAVDELIERAVAKGEQDDITAILIEVPSVHKEIPQEVQSEAANFFHEEVHQASATNWLRTSLIILFALILMIVVALLVWSWSV